MSAVATADDWARFLRPVAASVRNIPGQQEFAARVSALAFALRVPTSALTEARQRDLCRKCEFWPSIAEIEALFAEHWRDMARTRALATAGGAPMLQAPKPVEITDEDRQAMSAKAKALIAELGAGTSPAARSRSTPRTLSPADLIAGYEAAGTPAALFRAEQLRRQFEGEA
jgi:hypothetical protein